MQSPSQRALSRRDFLRLVSVGGTGLALVACVPGGAPSAGNGGASASGSTTLQTGGWPIYAPYEEVAPGTFEEAYMAALDPWLQEHPDVTLETIEVNIWDGDSLRTAIGGGIAPAWYPPGPVGNWNTRGYYSAFSQDMYADLTDLAAKYNLEDNLSEAALAGAKDWKMGDRVFAIPVELVPGNGFFFRRDHLAEAGLEPPPTTGWSWPEFREYARLLTTDEHKGLVTQRWGIGWILGTSGMGFEGLLSYYPTPENSWPWRWDFTTNADTWVERIELYRAMMFEDESILSDITYVDGPVRDAFGQGQASMVTIHGGFFTTSEFQPLKEMTGLESMDEIIGFAAHPDGVAGMFGATQPLIAGISLSPDLSEQEMDLAYQLLTYLELGDGFVREKQTIWESTSDASLVYEKPWPFVNSIGSGAVPGVSATPADALGPRYVDAIEQVLTIPVTPSLANYLPPEENPAPTNEAWEDKMSRWSYEAGNIDIYADLQELENILNQQAQGFTSSISTEEFVEGMRGYYEEWDSFLEQHAPDFRTEYFLPFYDEKIAPALR